MLYDKQQVAHQFGRAAAQYHCYNDLQQKVANALIDRIPRVNRLLDLGCGPAINAERLSQLCQHYTGLDLSAGMLRQAQIAWPQGGFLQGDAEQLPLADNSIGGVFSNLTVQWCNHPRLLLRELHRVVQPGGTILISTVLPGSLQPLTDCRRSLNSEHGENSYPDLSDWKNYLAQIPALNAEEISQSTYTFYAPKLKDVLLSIKGVGAGYQPGTETPMRRRDFQQVADLYEQFRTPAGLPLHYQIGFLKLCVAI